MNSLQIFNYQNKEVRVIQKDGQEWWVAKDVCDILDLSDVTMSLSRLDEDERSKFNLGRQGETNIINEAGLYSLIMSSRKPEAKNFKRWITHEVIPSIRKTGSYSTVKTVEPTKEEIKLQELQIRARKEARLSAQFYLKEVVGKLGIILSEKSKQQIAYETSLNIFGTNLIERPVLESKLYQATDIANEAGVSSNFVGRTANKYGLKTEEYGEYVLDKSRYSDKQISSFLYNEKGRIKILEILKIEQEKKAA